MPRFKSEKSADPIKDQAGMAKAEASRIAALIERDKRYSTAERHRREAEIEVGAGKVSLMPETHIPPTEEWLAKGPTETYIPRQEKDTTVQIRTRRRINPPLIKLMWNAGRLSDEQYAACRWFRDRYDMAGLDGRVKTSHISMTAGTSGGGGGDGQNPMPLHAREAAARIDYRQAVAAIPPHYLRFFTAVVIDDVPLRRAGRFARFPDIKIKVSFNKAIQALMAHLVRSKIDFEAGRDEHWY